MTTISLSTVAIVACSISMTGCISTKSVGVAAPPPKDSYSFQQPAHYATGQSSSWQDSLAVISASRPITQPNDQPTKPVQSPQISQDATPLTSYFDKDTAPANVSFSDAYTRLVITARLPEASKPSEGSETKQPNENINATAMVYRERNWFSRYFFGDKYDLSLTAKIKVNGYEEIIPLATLSRASSKTGEIWLRDMTSSLSSFPWFLVKRSADQASTPRVTIEFNGSRTYESGLAGTALQVAVAGIKMVSPEAGVVTTLSSGATQAKANAIDKALGELFAKKLSERYTSDRNLGKWTPTGGLQVTLNLPKSDGDWNGDLASVGEWVVNFDAPRPSVFSDWYMCHPDPANAATRCKKSFAETKKEVAREKDAASILVFPLVKTTAGSLSIRDYLQQQAWFTTAQASFSGNGDANQRAGANVCATVADTVLKLGLSSFDASMVVWAVMNGMPTMPGPENKVWDNRTCKDIVANLAT